MRTFKRRIRRMEQEDLTKGVEVNFCDGSSIMSARDVISFRFDLLPTEIQIYILSKIPVVDLGRVMSVCKLWFNTITKDQDFALSKLAQEEARHPTPRFSILVDRYHGGCNVKHGEHEWRCNTSHYLEFEVGKDGVAATCIRDLNLDIRNAPMVGKDHSLVRVVCCCDGIVISTFQDRGFFICNPITGLSTLLPPVTIEFDDMDKYRGTIWGFGYYDTATDPNIRHNGNNSSKHNRKYKLVGLRYTKRDSAITSVIWHALGNGSDQEQTPSTSAWKGLKIQAGYKLSGDSHHRVVFTNGTINWLCQRIDVERAYLLSFDLLDEKMKATSCSNIPASMTTRSILRLICLLGISGSLYLIFPPTSAADYNMEIWTMKDWDSMTWVKTYVIEAQSLLQIVLPGSPACIVRGTLGAYDVFPLGITMNASELILRIDRYSYKVYGHKAWIVAYDLATSSLTASRFTSSLTASRFGALYGNFSSFIQRDEREKTRKRYWDGGLGDFETVSNKFHVNTLVNWSI